MGRRSATDSVVRGVSSGIGRAMTPDVSPGIRGVLALTTTRLDPDSRGRFVAPGERRSTIPELVDFGGVQLVCRRSTAYEEVLAIDKLLLRRRLDSDNTGALTLKEWQFLDLDQLPVQGQRPYVVLDEVMQVKRVPVEVVYAQVGLDSAD